MEDFVLKYISEDCEEYNVGEIKYFKIRVQIPNQLKV
jgi:hypothetical protein